MDFKNGKATAKILAKCSAKLSLMDINGEKSTSIGADMSFMGRAGSYQECANVICFLARDEAAYVTGQCYTVDGGRKQM